MGAGMIAGIFVLVALAMAQLFWTSLHWCEDDDDDNNSLDLRHITRRLE
jgi:hypothetical protein